MQKNLSLPNTARFAERINTEEQHDSPEKRGKRQSDRIARASVQSTEILYGVSEEENREENENATNGLVPDNARGPHDFRHHVGRELSSVFNLNGLGYLDCVSKLHFSYLAVYLFQQKARSEE
jgi:hypothetical protein